MDQLNKLATLPTNKHVFTATDFRSLELLSNQLVQHACVEVTGVQPDSFCAGATGDVTLYGNGFVKVVLTPNVTCNFRTNGTIDHVVVPTCVSETRLVCRPPVLYSAGTLFFFYSFFFIRVSNIWRILSTNNEIRVYLFSTYF